MEQFIIRGGNPLAGEVEISGAKNAALGILAASVMTEDTVLITNLPDVRDINVMLEAMTQIGVKVERITRHDVLITSSMINAVSIDYEFIKKIRASYYLLGALLGRFRKAEVPLPGGCDIGSRPIDLHLKGFKALGASVSIRNGSICAEADQLRGCHIYLDTVSVGATINIMMAASMAEGRTIIENCAREPHVVDVANFLNSMGANIRGAGTDVIRIRGVEKLHSTEYSIIPDQIEAGTFMFAAAVTRGVQRHPGCGTTIKHFCCNNQEDNRMFRDSVVSERALREIYLRGFGIAIRRSHPLSMMTSYNLINGIHAANSYDLCTRIAREEFGFDGFIMTDWTTTEQGPDCTAAGCIRAGNDMIMPGRYSDHDSIRGALADGSLSLDQLRACVTRIVRVILQSDRYVH